MQSYSRLIQQTPNLAISGNQLDMQMQSIQIDDKHIRLRSKLWQVLVHLVENQNKLVPRQALIDYCWQGNSYTGEQGVTHTVCHLRRIFKKYGIEARIITIPKRGYILEDKYQISVNDTFMQAVKISHNINSCEDLFTESFLSLAN